MLDVPREPIPLASWTLPSFSGAEAVARGANAVIGVRFTTSMVMQGSSEILVYGTAVVLAPE